MDRRKFFSFLPLSALGLAVDTPAEPAVSSKDSELSPWVEWTCEREIFDYSVEPPKLIFRCGTKFKFIRGAHPYCPKCGALQYVDSFAHRDKMAGIEIQ